MTKRKLENSGYRELGELISQMREEQKLSNLEFPKRLNELNKDIIEIDDRVKASSNLNTVGHPDNLLRIPHVMTLFPLERFTGMTTEEMITLILRDLREAIAQKSGKNGDNKTVKRTVRQEEVLDMVEGMSDGALFLLVEKIFDRISDPQFRKKFIIKLMQNTLEKSA